MMHEREPVTGYSDTIARIKEVREQAIHHTIAARQLAAERRDLMNALIDEGISRAQIARELGVTRQAIQKMLAC